VCTILVFSRARPEAGLVVLANRDEFYARPTAPPRVLDPDTGAVGGLDLVSGGTWMGATPSGFFVGVTNQRTWHFPGPAPKSRGQVALDALREGSREGVATLLSRIDPAEYNPFNLIYGDAAGVEVAYARKSGVERHSLGPGLHVLANDRIGSPDFPKTDRARALASELDTPLRGEGLRQARHLLADHATPPRDQLPVPPDGSPLTIEFVEALQALCIHTPEYGTRSSTVIIANEGALLDYRYADGPPCQASFESVLHLFDSSLR
jgi:uncharacterized protein with NRDE domain